MRHADITDECLLSGVKRTFVGSHGMSANYPKADMVRRIIGDAFRAHGLSMPSEHVTTDTLHVRNHLLATGRFLTIIAGTVLSYNAKQWSLKALPVDLRTKSRPHAIVTLKNRTLNPVAELFIRELKTVARSAVS
jgi:DNA-binding transcriptional LysR family regulator